MLIKSTKLFFPILFFSLLSLSGFAQGPAKGKIEPERDPVLEVQSQHNLEVARYYILKRKGYQGGISRLQEILDTNPTFSRLDEVYFLMGEASLKLKKTEDAENYYGKIVKDFPESEYYKKAKEQKEQLEKLK